MITGPAASINEATDAHVNEALQKINGNGPRLNVKPGNTVTVMNPESKKTCVVNEKNAHKYLGRKPAWTIVPDKVPEVAKVESPKAKEKDNEEDTSENNSEEEDDGEEEVTITKDSIKQMDQKQLRQLLADAKKVISLDGMNLKKARAAVAEALGLE